MTAAYAAYLSGIVLALAEADEKCNPVPLGAEGLRGLLEEAV